MLATQRVTTWPTNPGRCNLNNIADQTHSVRIPRSVLDDPYVWEAYKRTNLDPHTWSTSCIGSHGGNEQSSSSIETVINVNDINTLRPEPTSHVTSHVTPSLQDSQDFDSQPSTDEQLPQDLSFSNNTRLIGRVFDDYATPSSLSGLSLSSEHPRPRDTHVGTGSPMPVIPWSSPDAHGHYRIVVELMTEDVDQDADVAHMSHGELDAPSHSLAGSQVEYLLDTVTQGAQPPAEQVSQDISQEESTSHEPLRVVKRVRTTSPSVKSNLSNQEAVGDSRPKKRTKRQHLGEGENLGDPSEE